MSFTPPPPHHRHLLLYIFFVSFSLKHGPTKLYTSHNTRREPNLIGRKKRHTCPVALLLTDPTQTDTQTSIKCKAHEFGARWKGWLIHELACFKLLNTHYFFSFLFCLLSNTVRNHVTVKTSVIRKGPARFLFLFSLNAIEDKRHSTFFTVFWTRFVFFF